MNSGAAITGGDPANSGQQGNTDHPADQTEPPLFDRTTHTLSHGGLDRRYLLDRPAQPGAAPVPLLLMLHAGFGTAEGFARVTGISRLAAARGYLVCFPQGYLRSWNAGECCGPAMREGVDDVGFLREVMDQIAATVDGGVRTYPVGFSNGAAMAYRLGCELTDRVAGIVAVASAMRMPDGRCRPSGPLPVLHVHGDLDRSAPLAGGRGMREQAGEQPPVASTIAFWVDNNGLSGEPVTSRQGTATTTRYGTDPASTVVQVVVGGLGHQWPGGPAYRPDVFGPQVDSPSASQLAVDFVAS